MDIDMVYLQGLTEKETKDKQCTKGHCFMCNKHRHIKRNCLSIKQDKPSQTSCNILVAHAVQVKTEMGLDAEKCYNVTQKGPLCH